MESNATPVTPTAVGLRYGILLALTAIIVDFLVRIAGFSFMVFTSASILSSTIVAIVWLVLAHRAFKQGNGNLMSFSQGLIIAVVMLLIFGVTSSLFNYVYLNFIDTEFVDRLKAGMTEFLERNNVPDDQIAKNTSRMDEMNMDLPKTLLSGISRGLGFGAVLGAIVTLFTKRSAPEFE